MDSTATHRPDPILRTKLYPSPVRAELIFRERLHELMNRGLQAPLILVSAPAGYGKSTLVSHWAAECEISLAWVSLDKAESEIRVFLGYLLAGLRDAVPGAWRLCEEMANASELPPLRVMATQLANELADVEVPVAIVLDDYHRIGMASPVHELLRLLLEHPPEQLTLVLLTRRDPPLPLAGLRAAGLMTEVRMQDLRFTPPETMEFLARTAGLSVDQEIRALLQAEVEGWAAGLHLVSLALRQAENPRALLKGLGGGLPSTQDFLLQEVLNHLPPEVREGLLRASILDRFCPSILEEVCGSEGSAASQGLNGQELLDRIVRANLFVIALDIRGEWFRLHHLFQTLLDKEMRLRYDEGDIAALHRRASDWFATHGLVEEAVRHALEARDPSRAAEIVEQARHEMLNEDRWWVVETWLDLLPMELKKTRLELLLTLGWTGHFRFQLDLVSYVVEQAGLLLDTVAARPTALAELSFFRGELFYWEGKGEESRLCLEEAVEQFAGQRTVIAGEAEVYLSLARQMAGEGESIVDSLEVSIRKANPTDYAYLTRVIAGQLYVHLLLGELAPALRAAERLWVVAERWESTYAKVWSMYPRGLAQLHSWRLDDAAEAFLFATKRRSFFERRAALDAFAGVALSYQLSGQPERASVAVDEQIAFARELGDPEPNALAESLRARIALLQGRLDLAVEWETSVDPIFHAPSLCFFLENPAMTRIRVMIAKDTDESLERALETLGALGQEVEGLHLIGQSIEIQTLQAVGLQRLGRGDDALVALRQAIAAAEPGGWIRPFVEAGPVMATMFDRLGTDEIEGSFKARVFAAMGTRGELDPTGTSREHDVKASVALERPSRDLERSPERGLLDPDAMTNRELDVLELLARRFQNKEIAAELFITGQTVNGHLKHVYQKLGVHDRRSAVARARELGILAPRVTD